MNAVATPRPQAVDPSAIFKRRYANYIGGQWVEPRSGQYFDNLTPVTGKVFTQVPRSNAEDIELALDAAHAAKDAWGKASTTERANVLLRIADRIEQNLDLLAHAETWDNGKPIRETLNADIPLCADHFRYFASAIRTQEGSIGEIDGDTIAYHFHEPLGVVGQIIPWNFPLLMACWKLAPALAAGNCVVLKPAEQTPASILVLLEVIGDDLLLDGPLTMETSFDEDLPLESIEFVALSEQLLETYGDQVDFVGWLAEMELDEIVALTVGQLVEFVAANAGAQA